MRVVPVINVFCLEFSKRSVILVLPDLPRNLVAIIITSGIKLLSKVSQDSLAQSSFQPENPISHSICILISFNPSCSFPWSSGSLPTCVFPSPTLTPTDWAPYFIPPSSLFLQEAFLLLLVHTLLKMTGSSV